jgi:hypothetical protein
MAIPMMTPITATLGAARNTSRSFDRKKFGSFANGTSGKPGRMSVEPDISPTPEQVAIARQQCTDTKVRFKIGVFVRNFAHALSGVRKAASRSNQEDLIQKMQPKFSRD